MNSQRVRKAKTTVVFEKVYNEQGIEVAHHTDINSVPQRIDFPKIGTTAKDSETGNNTSFADENFDESLKLENNIVVRKINFLEKEKRNKLNNSSQMRLCQVFIIIRGNSFVVHLWCIYGAVTYGNARK